MSKFQKYGFDWPSETTALGVEFWMIRKGDEWLRSKGRSLFFHYKQAQTLLWPKEDHHRWSDLILQTFCENEITVLMGCSDSGKTWGMSKIILVDYWCFPEKTLWLVSTTEGRGSELRIWGAIKDLFNQAKENGFDDLPGNPIDYLKTITTDSFDEDRQLARSLRRGIIVVPCKTGGTVSGLAPYIGIKAPRLRHAGDEVPAMSEAFLNAYANWYGKEDFKGIMSGNFMETDDPLGIASEPDGGWSSFVDTGKTQTWRSKFYRAAVVALDGRDTPNNDALLPNKKPRYPYLISQKKLDGVSETKGTSSWEWYSQCVGKPVQGMDIWRVFTKDFCALHKASDDVVWKGTPRVSLYALDPAYGLGDRCVGRKLEFGEDVSGQNILFAHPPEIIPIIVNNPLKGDAESQIADYVKARLSELSIPPQNCFYDSFGRGTLGFAFAKVFGSVCPVPIDSGASPTKRPVRFDMWVELGGGQRELKRCDQHYTKFITELWFSGREAVDSEQVRGLDAETIREGCSRKFTKNNANKIEVETKEDMKERLNRSPDLMDNFAIGVEGARRLGFKIQRLVADEEAQEDTRWKWFRDLQNKHSDLRKKHSLSFRQ